MEDARVDAGRGSPEKCAALIGDLQSESVTDEEGAQLRAMLQMVGPFALRAIPSDPDLLDAWLLVGARLALELRSDWSALPSSLTIGELLAAEPPPPADDPAELEEAAGEPAP